MPTKTKKSDDQLAQELGLVEERHEPECSSHLQKLLNRKSRSKTQAYADWMSLVEAQVAKEFIPQDLIQQTYDEINENERYYDGYTALVNDARDLQTYRRGLRHKKLNQKENFIKENGDRSALVSKLKSLKEEQAQVKKLIRELDQVSTIHLQTVNRADHIKQSNHRLFPHK